MMDRAKRIIILFIFVFIFGVLFCQCREIEEVRFADLGEQQTVFAAPELTEKTEYVQTIPCVFDHITGVGFHFANYGDRQNSGFVNICVYNNHGVIIADDFLDASVIKDGEYVYVDFNNKMQLGDTLEIHITSDSPEGQGVTIWGMNNPIWTKCGAELSVADEEQSGQLNCSIVYKSPKLSMSFWILSLIVLAVFMMTGVPQYYYERIRQSPVGKMLALCAVLLLAGVVIFSLRNLQFISTPIIYGEDGWFLARQLKQGILRTMFATRLGGAADFPNTGVYILIWLATKTTRIIGGFDLSAYPFWAGVYANLFLSFTAVAAFAALSIMLGRLAGFVAYCMVLLVNMGESSCEVFGRVLNTSFMWIVTVAVLLLILYARKNAVRWSSLLISILCFIGAFTFPICFLQIAIYLIAVFVRCIKDGTYRTATKMNSILIVALCAGICMLPNLLQSEGLGIVYEYNANNAIEFFLARHILYPFLGVLYTSLNNSLTVFLFVLYLIIVVAAAIIEFKNNKQLINNYIFFTMLVLGSWFASAFMRRTLTAICSNYVYSYPDRYFYACNILAMLLFFWAVLIVIEKVFHSKSVQYALMVVCLIPLFLNPNLFYYTDKNYDLLYGSGYVGDFSAACKYALENEEIVAGEIRVNLYPNGGNVSLPYQYVQATAISANKK